MSADSGKSVWELHAAKRVRGDVQPFFSHKHTQILALLAKIALANAGTATPCGYSRHDDMAIKDLKVWYIKESRSKNAGMDPHSRSKRGRSREQEAPLQNLEETVVSSREGLPKQIGKIGS